MSGNLADSEGDQAVATSNAPGTLEAHPLAELFPPLSVDEMKALADDIKRHGQRDQIVLLDSKILEGRSRYAACRLVDVKPLVRDYDIDLDGEDPRAFVVSKNVHRRHLSEGARAIIAAKLSNLPVGQRADRVEGSIDLSTAAHQLRISVPSVKRARKVLEKGRPELEQAVVHGDLSVSAAAEYAELPYEQQLTAIASDEKPTAKTAKGHARTTTGCARESSRSGAQGAGHSSKATADSKHRSANGGDLAAVGAFSSHVDRLASRGEYATVVEYALRCVDTIARSENPNGERDLKRLERRLAEKLPSPLIDDTTAVSS